MHYLTKEKNGLGKMEYFVKFNLGDQAGDVIVDCFTSFGEAADLVSFLNGGPAKLDVEEIQRLLSVIAAELAGISEAVGP